MEQRLSKRERQIVHLLVKTAGSNKEIARELGISDSTVKVQMRYLMRKLGLKNRVAVALWAIRKGIEEDD